MMKKKIKSRIWIEADGKAFLGYGRILLLKKLKETNSLNSTAKAMSISYKKAWEMLKGMKKAGRKPVSLSQTGGKNGGGPP